MTNYEKIKNKRIFISYDIPKEKRMFEKENACSYCKSWVKGSEVTNDN